MPASGKAGDLLANHVEVAQMYQECRARQKGLADHINKVKQVIDDRRI